MFKEFVFYIKKLAFSWMRRTNRNTTSTRPGKRYLAKTLPHKQTRNRKLKRRFINQNIRNILTNLNIKRFSYDKQWQRHTIAVWHIFQQRFYFKFFVVLEVSKHLCYVAILNSCNFFVFALYDLNLLLHVRMLCWTIVMIPCQNGL